MHRIVLALLLSLAPLSAGAAELSRAEKYLLTANDDTYVVVKSLSEYTPNICAMSAADYSDKVEAEIKARSHTKSIKAKRDLILKESLSYRTLKCAQP